MFLIPFRYLNYILLGLCPVLEDQMLAKIGISLTCIKKEGTFNLNLTHLSIGLDPCYMPCLLESQNPLEWIL